MNILLLWWRIIPVVINIISILLIGCMCSVPMPEGKWWFESAEGSCVTYSTDYAGEVVVTFDTAYPWGTIKKSN